MDKIILYSGNAAVVFSLGKMLLEEGWTVQLEDREAFTENQYLEIGRNANVSFYTSDQIDVNRNEPSCLVFPFFYFEKERQDYYYKKIKPYFKELPRNQHLHLFLFSCKQAASSIANEGESFYAALKKATPHQTAAFYIEDILPDRTDEAEACQIEKLAYWINSFMEGNNSKR